MKILVTGGSGFIGTALCRQLDRAGHELAVVSRDPARAGSRLPQGSRIEPRVRDFGDQAFDAIVNLAGEPIAEGRWSPAKKRRLIDSRIDTTRAVVDLCARAKRPPNVLVSASAMGYYGDQGEADVTERAAPNHEFVHELCERWESEARKAGRYGARVAIARIGLVLDRDGGMLARMLPIFRLGLGGRLGAGRQYMPWIHRRDMVRILAFLIQREDLSGPFNASAPEPVTNAEFTRALAGALDRPALLPVPAPALRLAFGEMSRLLLTGARMLPERLQAAGFEFGFPNLHEALADILGTRGAG